MTPSPRPILRPRLTCIISLGLLLLSAAAPGAARLGAQPTTSTGRPVDPAAIENLNRINDGRVKRGQKPLTAPGYVYVPPDQRTAAAAAAPAPAITAQPASSVPAASPSSATATSSDRVRELRYIDLVNRPEFWPAQCTLKVAMDFQTGTVKAGQKVKVDGFKQSEVELSTLDNKLQFSAAPEETDVVEEANRTYAAMTPAQRELTYDSLVRRKDLWPYRVKVLQEFNLGRGGLVRPGDEVILTNFERGKLSVLLEKNPTRFEVVPQATDLLAQARRFVADGGTLPSRVGSELEGKLVSSVTGKPTSIDPKALPKYFVFYRGSSTCSITRGFTPSLVKFYNENKKAHPEFEIVYIMTESPKDTGAFARELGFSWPAVEYGTTARMPVAGTPFGSLLPQLVVMDAGGNVLANGIQGTAPAALQRLNTLLNARTGKPAVPN